MFRSATKELFLNAGVHGIKYLVLSKRELFEKIVWIVILAASLVSVLWVSLLAWQGFGTGMVVTFTDSTYYPIWNVPFPAVTICNFNKISRRKAYQVARKLVQTGNMSRDELANGLKYLLLLSPQADVHVPPRTLWTVQDILERNNYTAHALYQHITPTCPELIHRCLWKGAETKCEAIFEQIPTPMGYCCTFNYYALKNHRFSGYLARRSPTKPRRVSACGYTAGIELLVHIDRDDYFASPHSSSGINVKVHDPYNYADSSWPDVWFSSDSIGFISLTPEAVEASSHVKEMRLQDRQCALPHELPLKTFGQYTYTNCLTECRMKLIYRYCGCIPFYIYNPNGTLYSHRICNLRDVHCIDENKENVWSSVPGLSNIDNISEDELSQSRGECKSCIPECEGVRYFMEMSTGILSRKHSTNKLNLYGFLDEFNHSVVRVFPSDLVITRHKRFVKYHWHTLFALFGGLVGLFTGMNFITGFEIVYYMTIRMFVNMYRGQTKSMTYGRKIDSFRSL